MIRPRIRRLFRLSVDRPDLVEDEVRDEIALHLELRAERLIAVGVPREEAYARARRAFGALESVEHELYTSARKTNRIMRLREWLEGLLQDGAYALRMFSRRPGFTAAAVLTLALGIGASTAIYSLVEATMLARLPFAEPEELRILWGVAGPERDRRGASPREIADWRTMTRSFDGIAVYDQNTLNLTGEGPAVQLQAEMVSPEYFDLLGVGVARGRAFRPEDDVTGAPATVIVSDALWRGRFGADPDILGRSLRLDGELATVIGIARPGFAGLSFEADVWATWAPFVPPGVLESRGNRWLLAVARLRDGVSDEVAFADLDAAAVRLEELHADVNTDRRADLLPLREFYLGDTRTLLLVLLGAVAFLLLIACANVGNLQLVHGLARGREIAIRNALGAGRGRIVRQLVTEAVVLSFLGGAAGVLVAHWGQRALLPLLPEGVLPAYADVRIHGGILAFTLLLVVACAVVAGLLPALRIARGSAKGALPTASRSTASRGETLLQRGVVAAEMVLAVALLIGAGLMVRSLGAQLRIDPGFQAEHTLVARVGLFEGELEDEDARRRFAGALLESLRGRAGITDIALASDAPLRGYNSASWIFREDRLEPDDRIRFYRHHVTPNFFGILGIPIVRGRGFGATDREESTPVAVVSESFAARVWPGEEPVGRRLRVGSDPGRMVEVVGVAGDVHYRDLTTNLRTADDDPDVYFPYAQAPTGGMDVLVRGSHAAPDARILREAVAVLAPDAPLHDVELLSENVRVQTAVPRFGSFVLGAFALLALLLACVGLYGVISFLVDARRRDIAVRIALGADRGRILRLVMGQGMALVLLGVVTGAVCALVATRFLEAFLYDIQRSDPRVLVLGAALLVGTAALANLIPAWRAAGIQPERALRAD